MISYRLGQIQGLLEQTEQPKRPERNEIEPRKSFAASDRAWIVATDALAARGGLPAAFPLGPSEALQ